MILIANFSLKTSDSATESDRNLSPQTPPPPIPPMIDDDVIHVKVKFLGTFTHIFVKLCLA